MENITIIENGWQVLELNFSDFVQIQIEQDDQDAYIDLNKEQVIKLIAALSAVV